MADKRVIFSWHAVLFVVAFFAIFTVNGRGDDSNNGVQVIENGSDPAIRIPALHIMGSYHSNAGYLYITRTEVRFEVTHPLNRKAEGFTFERNQITDISPLFTGLYTGAHLSLQDSRKYFFYELRNINEYNLFSAIAPDDILQALRNFDVELAAVCARTGTPVPAVAASTPAGAPDKAASQEDASSDSATDESPGISLSAQMDEAKARLASAGDGQPAGIYTMDKDRNFNVLDSVYYDPATDQLSLIGHFDPHFQGPRIPYLQHLATLMESPKPEFSLTWTHDSEKRVDALFASNRSQAEDDNIMASWGNIFDAEGRVTPSGRGLLADFGISPIQGNRKPGYFGAEVEPVPGTTTVQISSITPGSPAANAGMQGLQVGDQIQVLPGLSPCLPSIFNHYIRTCGAGTQLNIYVKRNGQLAAGSVTLAEDPDPDVWKGSSTFDVLMALYRASGDQHAADVIEQIGYMSMAKGLDQSDPVNQYLRTRLIGVLDLQQASNADLANNQNGTMSTYDAFHDMFSRIAHGFDDAFHFSGSPVYNNYERTIQQTGQPGDLRPMMQEIARQILPQVQNLLNPIFNRPEGLQIPPEMVDEQFHIHPEMVPEYRGIPGDSLLARAMFDGDYLCKRLMNSPELKQKIPGYQTGFEFEISHPAFRHTTANYRIWISVAKMDTPQSPDGKTLAFRDVKMRFNIREQTATSTSEVGEDLPNKPGGYEELLTSLWDNFEQQYPTLHELHEAAKLAAAAKWILQQNPSTVLPKDGRVKWQGPDKVPGLVYFELAPDPVAGEIKTRTTIIAEGGVSLTPFPKENVNNPDLNGPANPFPSDPMVVDLSGLGSAPADTLSPALFSHQQQDDLARQIFDKTITVPEPSPVAWIKEISAGTNNQEAITLDLRQLSAQKPANVEQAIDLRKKFEEAKQMAKLAADSEQAVTILNTPGPTQVSDFQNVQKEVAGDLNAYYRRLFQSAGMDIMDTQSYVSSHPSVAKVGTLADLTTSANTVENVAQALEAGPASPNAIQSGIAAIKDFSTALQSTAGQLGTGKEANNFIVATNAKNIAAALDQESTVAQLQPVADYSAQNLTTSNDTSGTMLLHNLTPFSQQTTHQLGELAEEVQQAVPAATTPGTDTTAIPVSSSYPMMLSQGSAPDFPAAWGTPEQVHDMFSPNISPVEPDAWQYIGRAGKFITENTWDKAQPKLREAFEAQFGVLGVVFINEYKLPDYIFPKILDVAQGNFTDEEVKAGNILPFSSANFLFNTGSLPDQLLGQMLDKGDAKNGVVSFGVGKATDMITDGATKAIGQGITSGVATMYVDQRFAGGQTANGPGGRFYNILYFGMKSYNTKSLRADSQTVIETGTEALDAYKAIFLKKKSEWVGTPAPSGGDAP